MTNMTKLILKIFLLTCIVCLLNVKAQEPLQVGTETEDIILTNDLNLAKAQVEKYPENPEAHFNLAIALSRTSLVEEAIKELRKTKLLIRKNKNADVIDKKITEYKQILSENQNEEYSHNVRYRLAFSYYLKAYLISKQIEKQKKLKEPDIKNHQKKSKDFDPTKLNLLNSDSFLLNEQNKEIKNSLEESIRVFNELLKLNPNDIWAKVYYGFIMAEQYNDLTKAKELWENALRQDPNNPAPHFFLGELKIKEGNLKEGIVEISQAILLRSLGN